MQESRGREASILIVDDEPGVRDVLEEYFAGHGYVVLCAESAHAARAIAAKRAIDQPEGISHPGKRGN